MTVSYEFTTMHIRPDNFTICIFAITIRMTSGAWIDSWSIGLLFAWRSRDMEFLHVVAAIAFAKVTILCDTIKRLCTVAESHRWICTGPDRGTDASFWFSVSYCTQHATHPFHFMREFKDIRSLSTYIAGQDHKCLSVQPVHRNCSLQSADSASCGTFRRPNSHETSPAFRNDCRRKRLP